MKHIYDGYLFMFNNGYKQEAQICITHSFPNQNFHEYSGEDDCTSVERDEIVNILTASQYTDYDSLIQLCDSLALPTGICLMEKRLVDVALRHGTNKYMIEKWKKLFTIFNHFNSKAGGSIYRLFPEVTDNTFGY